MGPRVELMGARPAARTRPGVASASSPRRTGEDTEDSKKVAMDVNGGPSNIVEVLLADAEWRAVDFSGYLDRMNEQWRRLGDGLV